MKKARFLRILPAILGALLVIAAVLLYTQPWQNGTDEEVAWELTLVGSRQEQVVLDMAQVKAMRAAEGRGGFFSTVGTISGPFDIKGVPLLDLCDRVGGITASDALFISAQDGYSTVLSYNQITGSLDTFDPATMRLTPHTEFQMVLMYEMNGQPLREDGGRPLRLAIINDGDLITEGFNWVRWVNRIEVMPLKSAGAAGTTE